MGRGRSPAFFCLDGLESESAEASEPTTDRPAASANGGVVVRGIGAVVRAHAPGGFAVAVAGAEAARNGRAARSAGGVARRAGRRYIAARSRVTVALVAAVLDRQASTVVLALGHAAARGCRRTVSGSASSVAARSSANAGDNASTEAGSMGRYGGQGQSESKSYFLHGVFFLVLCAGFPAGYRATAARRCPGPQGMTRGC